MEGEGSVLLYDKHDVWRADLGSGTLTRQTRGAEEGLQFRTLDLDPERPGLVPGDALWLSVRSLTTKASGYARVERGRAVSTLLFERASVGGLRKARDAERYALRMERWDDSPDVFVGGRSLGDLVQVTETNPFQKDFAWGRTELVPYTTDAGHDLQGMLVYPAGFREGSRR